MISQKSIQEVLAAARVDQVIEEYVNLKRRGVNLLGLCPFHDEKTPSFTVSPAKNIYKCFGCGEGGGPVQFIMEQEQLSFPDAIRFLAGKYSIALEESHQNEEEYLEEKRKIDSLHIINNYALDYYVENLTQSHEGKAIGFSYFKERGFLEKTIEEFKLGFALSDGKAFTDKATKAGYKLELLQELGLASQKGYDFFRGRVMFPIHNLSGKVIAFSGRILDNNKKQPKYINSPETELYNKRKTLYGIHLAKKHIRSKDNCYIVEGYSDVISLYQSGIQNIVASSGTSLTNEQIRLIKRFTPNATLLYDGDKAGVKAALRGIDLLLENDMNTFIVMLPENEDPDSYMSKVGYQGFLDFIESNKKDFIFFKMDIILEETANDPVKRSIAIKDILESISKIQDNIKRDSYIKEASEYLKIEDRKLILELDKIIKSNKRKAQNQYRPPLADENRLKAEKSSDDQIIQTSPQFRTADFYQERDLTRVVIIYGDDSVKDEDADPEEEEVKVPIYVYNNIEDVKDFFETPIFGQIINEAYEHIQQEDHIPLKEYFLNHKEEAIRKFTVDILSLPYEYANWEEKGVFLQTQKNPEENALKDSYQAILRFKIRKIKKVIALLKEQIEKIDKDSEDYKHAILAFNQIQEQRMKLADELNMVIE